MAKIRTTLNRLGVPTHHPEALQWRRSYIAEVDSGELIGKVFRTSSGKQFYCKNLTRTFIMFYNITMERKKAKFLLPYCKQYTSKEQIKWLENNLDMKSFKLSRGCQLHGDVDATIILKDGTHYEVPWNY